MNKPLLPKLTGLFVLAVSLIVYILTLEPTTSFWDCSEFITCAYGLEIGHAPGAPVFMLLGKFFSLFAGGDVSKVAFMVNMVSAVASAFTIFFLYWTLVWFIKKIVSRLGSDHLTDSNFLAIYGSAALGALSFAFTDSFWFSAVEGEVYATSSLFSAVAFWAITKWEQSGNGKPENRWIILIFYMLGLSVGIHLLNTLTIPAIALVYYYKIYKPSVKGILLTLFVSFLIILLFIFVIIPGIVTLAAYLDLLFVNSFGFAVYIGAIIFVAGLIFLLIFLHWYADQTKKGILKLVVLSFSFWLIGYSSFALLVIRSASNPFVDMNNVENLFGLVNYLNREQYPQRPLIYGNNYNSPVVDLKERYTYKLYDLKYMKDELNPEYIFDNRTLTLFPRMASQDPGHAKAYQSWVDIKGRPVEIQQDDGSTKTIMVPTFSENFEFFIKYQLGYMYFRYLMWNFSGRQNDIQGHGGVLNGNWITGIPFVDKMQLGPQDNSLDTVDQKKSRCVYFMLPLILGLIGMAFQLRKDRHNFFVNLMLFFMTGIAIAIYLNEIPSTPRERDYVYVGSFYAFSVWIGLGSLAILSSCRLLLKNKAAAAAMFSVLLAAVPLLLLYQNYSCHDRSNRYTARDFAKNMLESCDKDAILFTTADNDTYPVWYIQEVEGFRKDVRQILEPFISLDWYADQLNQPFEGKKDLQFGYRGNELLMDNNLYFPIIEKIDSAIDLNEALEFLKSNDPRTMVKDNNDNAYHFLPGKKLKIKVNKANFIKSCSYAKIDEKDIPNEVDFELKETGLNRDALFVLDLIAKANWERPVYFISTNIPDQLGLSDYLHPEGLLYRLMPYKDSIPPKLTHSKALHQYRMLKDRFSWGNINSDDVYLDQMNIQMVSILNFRKVFAEVAIDLVLANEKDKALELLDMAEKLFPGKRIPYTYEMAEIAEAYYVAGEKQKADQLLSDIGDYFNKKLSNYYALNQYFKKDVAGNDNWFGLYTVQKLYAVAETYQSPVKEKLEGIFNRYNLNKP